MTGPTVVILGFHIIGESPPGGWDSWFYIPETIFVEQLNYLATHNWTVIALKALLRGIDAPDTLPERAVLLTFDDGYRSLIDVALPRLLEFGYPAVVFVPTEFIGGRNLFDADEEPEEAICDWHDLAELERRRVSVQSHGVSHRSLCRLTSTEQEEELVHSKAVLEQRLNRPVEVFAYPYGDGAWDAIGERSGGCCAVSWNGRDTEQLACTEVARSGSPPPTGFVSHVWPWDRIPI